MRYNFSLMRKPTARPTSVPRWQRPTKKCWEKGLQFAFYSLQSPHGHHTPAKGSYRFSIQLHAEEWLLAFLRGDRPRPGTDIAGHGPQARDQPAERSEERRVGKEC